MQVRALHGPLSSEAVDALPGCMPLTYLLCRPPESRLAARNPRLTVCPSCLRQVVLA